MRFRHNLTGKNRIKRVVSFLLMLCLLVPMLPSSIGLDAKAEDDTTTTETTESTGDTVTITLHDLYIDRKEALPDGTDLAALEKDNNTIEPCLLAYKYARKITVTKGTTLKEIFEKASAEGADAELKKNTTLGTSSLKATGVYKSGTEDKNAMTSVIDAKNCGWYTRAGGENGGVDGNNTRTKFESSTTINDNIDLYTYSYRIRLITANSGDDRNKDLIVREGQTSGFVYGSANNIDDTSISKFLSENSVNDTTWTDVNEDAKADTSALANGITRNYALRADGVTPNTIDVPCNVAINGQWTDTGKTITLDLDRVDVWGKTGPALNYYVTDDELLKVYGNYGFTKDMLQQQDEISKKINGYFPFQNGGNLIIRQLPKWTSEGQFRIPLVEDTTNDVTQLNIYYTPHNTEEYTSHFLSGTTGRDSWASVSDSAVLKENSFYTVSVDKNDDFDGTLPEELSKKYLYGSDVTFTLPLTNKDGSKVKWYVEKGGDNVTIKNDEENNTATVTVDSIDSQLILTTDKAKEYADDVQVHCYILANGKPLKVGELHTHNTQVCDNDDWGTGDNKTRYYVTAKQVSTIYQSYGFKLDGFNPKDNYCFAVANTKRVNEWNNPSRIWPDTVPRTFNGSDDIKIPVVSKVNGDNYKNVDLYYVPNNTSKQKDGIWINSDYGASANTSFINTNTFYSVDVKDEAKKLGSAANLPATQYFLTGTDATVTVPTASGVTWYGRDEFENGIDVAAGTESDNQVPITIPKISCATTLTTKEMDKNVVTMRAFVAVDGEWKAIKIEKLDKQTQLTTDQYYYITAKKLEEIYGNFGFSAKDATEETLKKQFASTTTRDNDGIAKVVDTTTVDGKLCVKTIAQEDQNKGISLYYVPSNTGESLTLSDSNTVAANNFYSISTNNSTGSTLTDAELPSTQYFRAGTNVEFSLPAKVEWYIQSATIAKDDCFILKPKDKTTSILSVSKISTSIVLTATDKEHSNAIKKADNVVALHCYALVNGTENEVSTVYFSTSQKENHTTEWGKNDKCSHNRYYISTQALEKVYRDYSFVFGERYFPCTAHGTTQKVDGDEPWTLWVDAVPILDGGYYKIPLLWAKQEKLNIDIIYSPHNKENDEGYTYFNKSKSRTDTDFIKDNTFYTIDFEDPEKKFSNAKLPDTQYALTGTDKTVTLPYNEKVNWFQNSTKLTPVKGTIDDTNGKAQYTISKVTQKTTITTAGIADDKVAVQGYISLDGKWKNLSSMEITTEQSDGKNFYVTSNQLNTLFGSCGFKASDYQLEDANKLGQHFLNPDVSDSSKSKLVATKAALSDDTWQVTTSTTTDTKTKVVKLYYVPNNETEVPDASSLEADNTFYSISFADDGKTGITVPDTQYILKDSNETIELPKEAKNWFCTASAEGAQIALSDSTFQITDANQSLKFNTKLEDYTVTVHSRVFVDDEPYDVTTIYLKNQTASDWANGARYYVTAKTLSLIYHTYGFDLSKYHPDAKKGDEDPRNLWFPNAVHEPRQGDSDIAWNNPEVLWDDTTPSDSNDGKGYKIALSQQKSNFTDLDLYYVPKTTKEHIVVTNDKGELKHAIYIGSSLDSTKNHAVNVDFINANSFYSIQFKDPNNKLNEGTTLPDTEYHLSGTKSVQVTVPYQEGVTWHVTDKQGNPIDMSDILQTKDETNKTITFTISTIDQPLVLTTADVTKDSVSENTVALNAYVAIDDEWVPIGSEWTEVDGELTGGTYSISDTQCTNDKYYITARQLKNIFGKYGFNGKLPTDKNPFAYNTIIPNASESLQANQRLIYADELKTTSYIQTIQVKLKETGIAIYYVPNGYNNKSTWSARKDDADLLKTNSLQYTVSAADPNGLLSDTQDVLPEAKRWDREKEATITLPTLSDGLSWVPVNAKTRETIKGITSTTSDGKITYTITSITQPVEFIAQKTTAITIQYDVGFADSDKQQLGSDFDVKQTQTVLEDGTIQGATSYWDYQATRSTQYVTLQPDHDYVQVEVSNQIKGRVEPREFYYTFKGWKIVTDDTSTSSDKKVDIKPGEQIDLTEYSDSTLKLKSVWEAYDAKGRPTTVNFYLSTSCEVKDNLSNGFQGQAKENFTTTIYSTRIKGTDPITSAWDKEFQVIAPPNNESTAYQTDKTLRESVNTAIPYSDGNAQINLESFPSDEEILSTLRRRVKAGVATVTLDGNEIPASDLNTTNYEVRWYVLKYHKADSWHIDGVLVAKEGHVIVTKTFDGDEKAIEYVKGTKDNKDGTAYAISVTHESSDKNSDAKDNTMPRDDTDVVDYMLALQPKSETDDDSIIRGYDSYDETTNTYTWILSGRQGREYTLQEQNYQVNEDDHKWSGTYQYMIRNSPTESDGSSKDTNGWLSYTSSSKKITLKAAAYASDAPKESYQTVAFKNTYAPYGSISLAKIDDTTGSPLKDVQFTLEKDGSPVTLYQKNGTSEYKHDFHTDDEKLYNKITNGKITTNANGMLYLGLATGKYTLTETPPFGYDGPSSITFSVDKDGKISQKDLNADVENLDTEQKATSDWVIISDNQVLLNVKNTSKMLVTVTAQKVWENTDADKIKPVTVSLYRNGVKMSGDKYTQELSEKNNWVYTWYDLPLYVDDAIAEYSLREEKIGDTAYDLSNGSNGYQNYLVKYDSTKYVETLTNTKNPEASENWKDAKETASWDENGSKVYAKHALLVVRNSSAESDLILKKTDSLGNALEGAVFGIYEDQACTKLISKAESDSNGYVRFKSHSSLGDHVRYLKEISAPDGCTPDTTIYTVTVTVNSGKSSFTITAPSGTELSKSESDAQGNTYYQIQNQSAVALQIKKIDKDGNPLTGAEFTVTKYNTTTKEYETFGTYKVENANTGTVQIKDAAGKLPEGTYRIEETKLPDEKFQKACPIDVTIQGGRVMYDVADDAGADTNKNAWQLIQREGTATYVLRVVNKPPTFLPSTGGSGILLPILFGTALMGGASVLALWLRKRRKNG